MASGGRVRGGGQKHRPVRGLQHLEQHIDDCLALARGLDREGLARVIELRRTARNGVVQQAGG